jgi:predicted nucleic acid-binding protein
VRHGAVVETVRKTLEDGRELWTTSYVVLETVSLAQGRVGLAPLRDFAENLIPMLSVTWVTEALHRRGFDRLIRESRRHLSLVDCVSFEYMRERGLRDALALDTDFVEAAFAFFPPAPDEKANHPTGDQVT